MKKFTLSIIVASLLPFSMAMAGDVSKAGGDRAEMRAQHEAKFAEELGLTADQQAKIKAIKEKGQASRESDRAAIDAVLTPEQKAKMETMKAKHGPRGQGHGPKGGKEGAPVGQETPPTE